MNRIDLADFQSTYDFDESSEALEPLFVIGRTRRNLRPPRLSRLPKMEKVWHTITAQTKAVPKSEFLSETQTNSTKAISSIDGYDHRMRDSHAADFRTNDSARTHTIDIAASGKHLYRSNNRARHTPSTLRVPAQLRTDYELAKAEMLDDMTSDLVSETLESLQTSVMSNISTRPKSERRSSNTYVQRRLEDFTLSSSIKSDHDDNSSHAKNASASSKQKMSGININALPCPLCGSKNGQVTESNLELWATGAVQFDSDKNFKSFDVLVSYLENKEDLKGKQLDIE